MNDLINDVIFGEFENLSEDVVLSVNGLNLFFGLEKTKNYFQEMKKALDDFKFEIIKMHNDCADHQVFTWKISGKQTGVFHGFMPTYNNILFFGMACIYLSTFKAKKIDLFYDLKTVEDQICPSPKYTISKDEVFNNFHGNGGGIYSLLMSCRDNFTDSKSELIHALRKSSLRAPDLSKLNHQEIKKIKLESDLERKFIQINNEHKIELFIYSPAGKSLVQDLPTILYLHGGGWSIGSPENYELTNRKLALSTNTRVICPRYRLAPEHPYPSGFEDCCQVYDYLCSGKLIDNINYNSKNIMIAGDSVGGGFAAALILKANNEGKKIPNAALLFSPATDMRLENYHSYNNFSKNNIMIDQGLIGLIRGAYVEGDLWDHPYVSPMRGNLSCFPRTFIMIGEEDPLYDENICFSNKIFRESGIEPSVNIGKDMPHHYHTFIGLSDEVDKVYQRLNTFLYQIVNQNNEEVSKCQEN